MRHFTFLLLVILSSVLIQAQTPSETIVFKERVYNFGTIKEEKGKVSHTFEFENKGKSAVTITDINSGCGCIGNVVSKKTVAPGAKGQVTVTFDPSYKDGFFSKEIVVMSNNNQQYNRIWVEGNIVPSEKPIENDYPYNYGDGLYLRLEVMAFGYVKGGTTKKMDLHFANNTDKEMTLSFVVEDNKGNLVYKNPGKIGAKAKGITNFSFSMPYLTNDDINFKVYPFVNGKKLAKPLQVRVMSETKFKKRTTSSSVANK